jgi:hypothetical protein
MRASLRLSSLLASVLTACGTDSLPATEAPPPNEAAEQAAPAQTEPVVASPTPPAVADTAVAGPLRWQDYACRATGPWEPGPALAAIDAPADAASSDIRGWYAEGRAARSFLWRARGAQMGELRWLRREGDAWAESGSGARRWPRALDPESTELVAAAPHFAILASRGGADNRFLAGMWLVSDAAAPRAIRVGASAAIAGALVTETGEVHLHLSEGFHFTGEQLVIHFGTDGRELARRVVVVENRELTHGLGPSPEGLVEATDGSSRLHRYAPAEAPTPLTLVPRFVEPYDQLESGVAPCPDERGLSFARYGLGMGFAPTESMLVTYEIRDAGTCVRAIDVPLYGPDGALDCERCDVVLEARGGALVGHALSSDGRIRGLHCATAPGTTALHPLERVEAEPSAAQPDPAVTRPSAE